MEKRGALELSFGMIFSVILIIAFLAFGIYAIISFLNLQDAAKIGQFRDKLQDDVNDVWRSSQASQEVSYYLPKKVAQVCFVNEERFGQNIILKPSEAGDGISPILIEHLNISRITGVTATRPDGRESCFDTDNSQVKFILEKNFGETLVVVKEIN